MKIWKKMLLISVVLALLSTTLMPTSTAHAWKGITHLYAANLALQDALDDGKVTIPPFGDYDVDPKLLTALRMEGGVEAFRAGAIGPDGFPDLITGQQTTHPGVEDNPDVWEADDWLWHLWRMTHFDEALIINDWFENWKLFAGQTMIAFDNAPNPADAHAGLNPGSPTDEEKLLALAFVHGYLSHAAGDMFGHTWVNYYAEGVFNFAEPKVVARHIVIEGYVDRHVPPSDAVEVALPSWILDSVQSDLEANGFYPLMVPANLVIDAPDRFVYMNLGFGRGITEQYGHREATSHLVIFWEWEQKVRELWYDARTAVDGAFFDFVTDLGVEVIDGYFADWVEDIQMARVRYIEASEVANLYIISGQLPAVPMIYKAWWKEYGKPALGIPERNARNILKSALTSSGTMTFTGKSRSRWALPRPIAPSRRVARRRSSGNTSRLSTTPSCSSS